MRHPRVDPFRQLRPAVSPGPSAEILEPMLRTKFFVAPVGDHWEVACTLRGHPTIRYPNRFSALQNARIAAQDLWTQERVACEVLVDEDDGQWHQVASFGALLDLVDDGLGWAY